MPQIAINIQKHLFYISLQVCGFINVINKHDTAEWDYVIVGQKALYNAAGSTDFDLHVSEETNLVNKILTLAGIVINKPGLAQTSMAMESTETQIKKQ